MRALGYQVRLKTENLLTLFAYMGGLAIFVSAFFGWMVTSTYYFEGQGGQVAFGGAPEWVVVYLLFWGHLTLVSIVLILLRVAVMAFVEIEPTESESEN